MELQLGIYPSLRPRGRWAYQPFQSPFHSPRTRPRAAHPRSFACYFTPAPLQQRRGRRVDPETQRHRLLLGIFACMADGPNKYLPPETVTAVVSSAPSLREELPEDDLSVNMAWIQMAEGSWKENQCLALIMGLVISLRMAYGISSTTIRWPDPKSYIAHLKRRAHSANQAHQLPGVGDGLCPNHESSHRPSGNRVHRHPRVGDGSATQDDSSHRRAGDWDHRRPKVEGDSTGHDGGSRRGTGDAKGSGTTRRNATGGRRNRGKGIQTSSDGCNRHRNRSRGDAYRASSSRSAVNGSGRATVPEITDINCKR